MRYQLGEIISHIIALLVVTPIIILLINSIKIIIIAVLSVISMFMAVDAFKCYTGIS